MGSIRNLTLGVALAAFILPNAGSAQDALSGVQQTEWAEGFDAQSTITRPVTTTVPILSPQTVPAMERAIYVYRDLVARGGWVAVPDDKELRIGVRDANVIELRRRLIASGDLRQRSGDPAAFDSYVQAAVMRFQERHGLPGDGIVGSGTLRALNVPAQVRLWQLEANLERIGQTSVPNKRYIMVNIPGAQIEAVENGIVASRHIAVVGKVDRQTPLVTSAIHEVNFNPFWHAPKSIVKRDIIPKMREDPEYLSRYSIRIYDGRMREIDPRSVDWYSDEAVRYLLRQDPGEQNALGNIRINFHNKHAVYLHDTPQQALFDENLRFHSSGCVRVENVRDFVTWLLTPNGDWTRQRVDETISSGERIDASLALHAPIYMVYVTAWAGKDGITQFRPDVYAWDAAGRMAIADQDI